MNKGRGVLLSVILILLAAPFASSQIADADQVIINSKEWTDIYSAMIYSRIKSLPSSYLIEETRAYLLIDSISKDKPDVLLFESPDVPYIKRFSNDLEGKGFNVESYDAYDNLNLDLARDSGVSRFFIMDSSYSYNAVSLAPYAVLERYYVIFADSDNIGAVTDFLDSIGPEEIIIYGYIDREVSDELNRFNPETINNKNKYENNVEIVGRFSESRNFSQYVLTSGTFIEPQFFTTENPVLFIGKSNLPESTLEYLQQSEVKHAVIIGNELFDIGNTLKAEADMKLMIKFAKGINSVQYSLDTIELPAFDMNPQFDSINYNPLSKQMIVIISNTGASPVMVRSTYTISKDSENIAELGDEETVFVGENSIVTITYDIDLTEYRDTVLTVDARMIYGEEEGSLDGLLVDEKELEFIEFQDDSEIKIIDAYYDTATKRFAVLIENNGRDDVYVLPIIKDIIINNKLESISGEQKPIESGKTERILIKARLSEEDIADNEHINVLVNYGSIKNLLINKKQKNFDFLIKRSYTKEILIGASALILIIMITVLMLTKRKKKRTHTHNQHNQTHHHAQGHQHHRHN